MCQDYAHLTIGLLRLSGVPARYVSGYLFAVDETAPNGVVDDHGAVVPDAVTVQTHAWVEAWLPGDRWLAVDPTNDQPVGHQHVIIGFGRDYDDVAPVRGIYSGPGRPTVDATVEIRHMEAVERTMTPQTHARRPDRRARYLTSTFDSQQSQQQQ